MFESGRRGACNAFNRFPDTAWNPCLSAVRRRRYSGMIAGRHLEIPEKGNQCAGFQPHFCIDFKEEGGKLKYELTNWETEGVPPLLRRKGKVQTVTTPRNHPAFGWPCFMGAHLQG